MTPKQFLQPGRISFIGRLMPDVRSIKSGDSKMMLGFIVRRCAADIGHMPTAVEFAKWANGQYRSGKRFCLFGKEISPTVAKIMFSQPGRLVTVSPEGLARIWRGIGR
jgi:hypothetical protein